MQVVLGRRRRGEPADRRAIVGVGRGLCPHERAIGGEGVQMHEQIGVVAPDDPRGPIAEVVATIAAPGEYVVGATYTGEVAPRIEMMATVPGRVARSTTNLMGPHGWTAGVFVVTEPGEVVIRIDGDGQGTEREVDLELYAYGS